MLSKSLLVAGLAAQAIAHPSENRRGMPLSKRGIDITKFRVNLPSNYKNANAAEVKTFREADSWGSSDPVALATQVVKKIVPGATFRVADDHYTGKAGVTHVYFKQTVHGIDVDNADFNVNIGADGKVFSFGNNFFTGSTPSSSPLTKRAHVSPTDSLKTAISVLGLPITVGQASTQKNAGLEEYTIQGTSGAVSAPKAKLTYIQTSDGKLKLTWRLETDINTNYLLSYVDADSNKEVVHASDWISHATFEVYPFGTVDPSTGSRTTVKNPENLASSPYGWTSDGKTNYTTSKGNNGFAQANWNNNGNTEDDPRPQAPTGDFSFPLDLTATDPHTYVNASVSQLFYTANMYHDVLYQLGFDEKAGNFEANNGNKGGKGGDQVTLNAQDGAGTNNADFLCPPDGQAGRMRMYLWTQSTPKRDCAFDASVILHEYTHGLSNRLTGGPANTNCLNNNEAGGMGEGWSDWFAIATLMESTAKRTKDWAMGSWIYNNPKGIREYVYSTNNSTNPYKYSNVDTGNEVHAIGTIWATMLYELFWDYVDAYGITADTFPKLDSNGMPADGRFLALKTVMQGLALQPCSPTFLTARDAIVDADKALTGGKNACLIWKAFARRGLGFSAKKGSGWGGKPQDGFDTPQGVC